MKNLLRNDFFFVLVLSFLFVLFGFIMTGCESAYFKVTIANSSVHDKCRIFYYTHDTKIICDDGFMAKHVTNFSYEQLKGVNE